MRLILSFITYFFFTIGLGIGFFIPPFLVPQDLPAFIIVLIFKGYYYKTN